MDSLAAEVDGNKFKPILSRIGFFVWEGTKK